MACEVVEVGGGEAEEDVEKEEDGAERVEEEEEFLSLIWIFI